MKFASVCSGIEAASVAWEPLGWKPVFFSEIEPFPSAVLAHHYPSVPNLGDMNEFKSWPDAEFDLLVGGTPCQSFSVAGLRRGLADPRGNLALVYLAVVDRYRPRWIVWENVPGVLSSNRGRDFGAFLGGLAELGYGWAYRILDAQHFGVPQRRRRVFVVGHLGDWRRAAAVLFEPASLRRDSPPRREKREGVAATLTRGAESGGKGGYAGRRREDDENLVAPALSASGRGTARAGESRGQDCLIARSLNAHGVRLDMESETFVTHSLRADGFDAGEDGTGRGTPLCVSGVTRPLTAAMGTKWNGNGDIESSLIAFDTTQVTSSANRINPKPGDPSHPLASGAHPPAVAFAATDYASGAFEEVETARGLTTSADRTRSAPIVGRSAVRRLTPRECERLQGFPDDYTLTPYRGKPAADGPRYKALGNSMAVPVMRWIGKRIEHFDRNPAVTTEGG